MHLFFPKFMSPLVSSSNSIHLVTNGFRHLEAIEGMGKDWRVDLIRVVLPAWDRSFAFHLCNLEDIFSTKNWKSAILLPLNMKSNPRYLLGLCTRLTTSIWAKESFIPSSMLGVQYRSDLERLILWPDKEQYQLRISWIWIKDWLSCWKNNKASSSKKRWVKGMPFLPILTPLILYWFSSFMRAKERMFAQKRNK